MWMTFCEGLALIDNGWAFTVMMVGLAYLVISYQKWNREQDLKLMEKLADGEAVELFELEDDKR